MLNILYSGIVLISGKQTTTATSDSSLRVQINSSENCNNNHSVKYVWSSSDVVSKSECSYYLALEIKHKFAFFTMVRITELENQFATICLAIRQQTCQGEWNEWACDKQKLQLQKTLKMNITKALKWVCPKQNNICDMGSWYSTAT